VKCNILLAPVNYNLSVELKANEEELRNEKETETAEHW